MSEAIIYDAIRTPRGKGKREGALYEVKPITLVTTLLDALAERNQIDPARVDDIIMGVSAALGDQGACLPRTAALAAGTGWPEVTGLALQRFCGSGLEAVNLAGEKVRSGWHELIVAGGFESLSRMGLGSSGGAMIYDPVTSSKIGYVSQGVSADLLASMARYNREDLDRFSVDSQQKAVKARQEGRFVKSLVPVKDQSGLQILAHDEYIRENTTLEGLAKLQPAFTDAGAGGYDTVALQKYPQVERVEHLHTSGNSSGIVDGAALVLVGSERIGRELGMTPRARIVSIGSAAVDPTLMLTGPVPAIRRALEKAGLSVDDIDLFEINEAFAVVPLYVAHSLNIPLEKINVNGGAIALGHPIGATGAMLVGTLLDELERRSLRYGVVTLCIAGGMGLATVIERL